MIKALQILLVKGCIALLIAAYAVCVVGGATADQPEWIRSGWKIAQNRGRPGMASEGATGEPDPNEIQSLRQRAEAGEASAQSTLGWKHYRGDGVPQNYTEAIGLLRNAAMQGNARAQCALGWMHYRGDGIPQNYTEAISLLRSAAMQGDIVAPYIIGMLHARGHGVPQNYREAYVWLSIAAANGLDAIATANDLNPENMKAETQRDLLADWLLPADLSAAQAEAARLHAEIQKNLEHGGATG